MATTIAYRPCGPTTGLSVTASSHAAVQITPTDASASYLMFVNTSNTVDVFVNIGASTTAVTAATVPGDGTTGSLPVPNLGGPIVYPATFTNGSVAVTAIGAAAGPTLITVTPVSSL